MPADSPKVCPNGYRGPADPADTTPQILGHRTPPESQMTQLCLQYSAAATTRADQRATRARLRQTSSSSPTLRRLQPPPGNRPVSAKLAGTAVHTAQLPPSRVPAPGPVVQRRGPVPCDCDDETRARVAEREGTVGADPDVVTLQRIPVGGDPLHEHGEEEGQSPSEPWRKYPGPVQSGGICPRPSDPELEVRCISQSAANRPPQCVLAPEQLAAVDTAKSDAQSRVQRALARAGTGAAGRRYALETARRVFTGPLPTPEFIISTLTAMEGFLQGRTVWFAGRSCGDPTCNRAGVLAYVTGPGQLPIYVCPRSFLPGGGVELRRTVIHEVAHLAGIDVDLSQPETYCPQYDCSRPCRGVGVADAWALFIDCLGEAVRVRGDLTPKTIRSIEEGV
jgi:hypothetical protein